MTPTADPVARLRRLRHLTLAGGIACAVLAAAWAATGRPPAPPTLMAETGEAEPASRAVQPARWRVAMTPMAVPAVAAPPAPPVPIRLISVMNRGGQRGAMIAVGDGRAAIVAIGGAVGGWTVSSIGDRAVDLEKDGERRRVELSR